MYCQSCGFYLGETSTTCGRCGWTFGQRQAPPGFLPPPPPNLGQDAGMRFLVPIGLSGWAIAAGYAGLFAFIVFPAPLALILGIVALIDIQKHPEKHGMGRAIFGLVTGSLGTIVLIVGLISALVQHR